MLTKEDFEALPEKARAAFTLDGDEYVPAKDAKLKQTLNELDSKYKSAEQKAKELEERLGGFETAKQQEFEKKLADELEKARSSGDAKALEERLRQQFADEVKREREAAKNEAVTEFKTQQAQEKASTLADKIGLTIGVDAESGELIADAIRQRIKIDPQTGEKIFHDIKGSALSVDEAGFMKEVANEKRFARLVKGDIVTTGGGNAKGNNGDGRTSQNVNEAAESAKKRGDLAGFLAASLKN